MRKTRTVYDLNNEKQYVFIDSTPMEALQKMIYTLNLKKKCNPQINKSPSGLHLWFEFDGITYAVSND